MHLVGRFPYRFKIGFDEQFFRKLNLQVAFNVAVLQLFPLAVHTIFPVWYHLHLTCMKNKHLNM